jgi:Bacterial Ig-like domain (group 2)
MEHPMNRTFQWMVGASLLATAGCAGTATEPPAGPPTLAIGPDTTLLADEAFAAPIVARDGYGRVIPSPSITWQSSAPAVASVDGSGHVTARALGTATLTATMDSIVVHATITVVPQFCRLLFSGAIRRKDGVIACDDAC